MNKEKYNQLRKEIIRICPDILKLKKNCKVKHRKFGYVKMVAFVDRKYEIVQYVPEKYGEEAHDILEHYDNNKFEIIGKSITLEDCLIAIKKNAKYGKNLSSIYLLLDKHWQLNTPLQKQEDETINFLYEIICNNDKK